jgi:hypothetical protein
MIFVIDLGLVFSAIILPSIQFEEKHSRPETIAMLSDIMIVVFGLSGSLAYFTTVRQGAKRLQQQSMGNA